MLVLVLVLALTVAWPPAGDSRSGAGRSARRPKTAPGRHSAEATGETPLMTGASVRIALVNQQSMMQK